MRAAEWILRVLLGCYPKEFRDEYAGEMTQAFRDQRAHDPRARDWIDLAADSARTAPRERAFVLMNDLRYALRTLRRSPAFSAAVS